MMKLTATFMAILVLGVYSVPTEAQERIWLTTSRIDGAAVGSQLDVLVSHDLWAGATLGVSRFKFGSADWTTLKAGASWRRSPSWVIATDVEAGPGSIAGDTFVYRKVRLQATYLAEENLMFSLADTWYSIGGDSGHVLAPSFTLSPVRDVSLTFETLGTVGARDPTRLAGLKMRVNAKLDWQGGMFYGSTGGAAAQSRFGLLNVAPRSTVRQVFVGTRFNHRSAQYDVLFEYFRVASNPQHRLSVMMSLPFGGDRAAGQ